MIYLYNDLTHSFVQKTKILFKEILLNDFNISSERTRFFYQNYFYPIQFAIFENQQQLAFFDARFYQLGLSKKLIYVKESILKDILRHEMIHYLTYIHHGLEIAPHGKEFMELAQKYKFKNDVTEPTLDLSQEQDDRIGEFATEKILEKVKKLMSLASSSNVHEAELATLKAQDILIKHNLSYVSDKSENIYTQKIYFQKRKTAKLLCILEILPFFMVHPIMVLGRGCCTIEVLGSKLNLELAEYLVTFLDRTLDELWNQSRLKGIRAKNSFFKGVSEGYLQKMKNQMSQLSSEDSKTLIKVTDQLKINVQKIYSRLRNSSSSISFDSEIKAQGIKEGQRLSIHPATTSNISRQLMLS